MQLNLGVSIAQKVAKGFVLGEVFKVCMNLQLFALSIWLRVSSLMPLICRAWKNQRRHKSSILWIHPTLTIDKSRINWTRPSMKIYGGRLIVSTFLSPSPPPLPPLRLRPNIIRASRTTVQCELCYLQHWLQTISSQFYLPQTRYYVNQPCCSIHSIPFKFLPPPPNFHITPWHSLQFAGHS